METNLILVVVSNEHVEKIKNVFGIHFTNSKKIDDSNSKILLHVTTREMKEISEGHPEIKKVKIQKWAFDGDALVEFAM